MKKQVDMVLNGKGGVGKSFFATHFIQYLKDQQIRHIAVDTDNENSTLKRFHRDALFINLAKPQAIDTLFVELEKAGLVVVDCRAASTDVFLDYFEELGIFDRRSQTQIKFIRHPLHSPAWIRGRWVFTVAAPG